MFTYGARKPLDLDEQLSGALSRMNGDTAAAAALFLRWSEQDSEIRALIPNVIEDYIQRRLVKLAKKKATK